MKLLAIAVAVLVLALAMRHANAQSAVRTQPLNVASTNASGTVTSTNVFQSVFAAITGNQQRSSCTVQNNGTHTMFVFFGPIANALTTSSVALTAGQATTCSVNGVVLKDQVSITGTTTENFFAAQQ